MDIEDVPEHADEETDVERSAFCEYDAAALNEALSRLTENYREALIMYYYHDMPLESVAATFGVSYEAAKSKLFRARKKLYVLLKEGE